MQSSHSVGHGLFRGGVVQTAGMTLSMGLPHTSSSHRFKREFDNVEPHMVIPLPEEKRSGEQIKTETELIVLF